MFSEIRAIMREKEGVKVVYQVDYRGAIKGSAFNAQPYIERACGADGAFRVGSRQLRGQRR